MGLREKCLVQGPHRTGVFGEVEAGSRPGKKMLKKTVISFTELPSIAQQPWGLLSLASQMRRQSLRS